VFIVFSFENQIHADTYTKKRENEITHKTKTSVATWFFYGCIKMNIRKENTKENKREKN
jgi:hypothetical protein